MTADNPHLVDHDLSDVGLLQSLAAIHSLFGRIERAINLLHLALWICPRDPETLRLMAVLCYRDGRLDASTEYIDAYEETGVPMPNDLTLIKMRTRKT
ncbi:MAG: hypothetical protein AAF801_05870 [Pseudomonadota bacterium]